MQAPRKLRFSLRGKKLQDEYELILFREEGERKLWLLIKKPTAIEAIERTAPKKLKEKDGRRKASKPKLDDGLPSSFE